MPPFASLFLFDLATADTVSFCIFGVVSVIFENYVQLVCNMIMQK